MARHRTALSRASIVLAIFVAGACAPFNEVVTGRDLECGEAPEDVCVRLADHKASSFERLNPTSGPIVKVTVSPHDCLEPGHARCWLVDAYTGAGARSSQVYFQRADGMLVAPFGELI
jgi:hypothetical protein